MNENRAIEEPDDSDEMSEYGGATPSPVDLKVAAGVVLTVVGYCSLIVIAFFWMPGSSSSGTFSPIWFALVAVMFGCGMIAKAKGRSPMIWRVLGILTCLGIVVLMHFLFGIK